MAKPIANLIEKPINLMQNIHREEFVDDYIPMETWLNDDIPVPGEVYREFAKIPLPTKPAHAPGVHHRR